MITIEGIVVTQDGTRSLTATERLGWQKAAIRAAGPKGPGIVGALSQYTGSPLPAPHDPTSLERPQP